jgi:DNA-binding MarR family transcriptional regulator
MTATAGERTAERQQALDRLGKAFKGATAAVRRLRGRDTHRHGELSYAQYHLLFGLAEHGELSAGDLALAADLTPATVTQLLDGLGSMGLVERLRSERDRRIVTCSLTDRGREVIGERRARFEGRWHAALAGFSTAELTTAAAVLDSLRGLFDEVESTPGAG